MTNLPAAATNQALAKKPPIVKFIEERRFQIGEMLPKHLPLERAEAKPITMSQQEYAHYTCTIA